MITSYHLLCYHPGLRHSQLLICFYNGFFASTFPSLPSLTNRAGWEILLKCVISHHSSVQNTVTAIYLTQSKSQVISLSCESLHNLSHILQLPLCPLLLFLCFQYKYSPNSSSTSHLRLLHHLCPGCNALFSDIQRTLSLISFLSLLTCHIFSEAFLNQSKMLVPTPFPFFFLLMIIIILHVYILLIYPIHCLYFSL